MFILYYTMLMKYTYKCYHPNKYDFYIILQYNIYNILQCTYLYIKHISIYMIKIGISSFYV
jgi:hypothetical protein